jgi:hypothetical protein
MIRKSAVIAVGPVDLWISPKVSINGEVFTGFYLCINKKIRGEKGGVVNTSKIVPNL